MQMVLYEAPPSGSPRFFLAFFTLIVSVLVSFAYGFDSCYVGADFPSPWALFSKFPRARLGCIWRASKENLQTLHTRVLHYIVENWEKMTKNCNFSRKSH